MFDSPLQDWKPGKLVRIGFPWHGRVDMDAAFTGREARLNLPNGQLMSLPYIAPAASTSRWQSGGAFVFRDPRAQPVELSESEAAKAAAAGAIWRPEVIINELGLPGGVRHRLEPGTWFIYHDGEQNWIASVSPSFNVNLTSTPIIDRGEINSTRSSVVATRTFPAGADLPPNNVYTSGSLVVIDAVPDGSRVLLASLRIRPRGDANPGYAFRQRNERWEAVAFYELRISGPGAAPVAHVDLLYGRADIEAGYSSEQVTALGRHTVMTATGFAWSTYANGETATSSASFPLDPAGSILPSVDWYESGNRTAREVQTRVVSMYYGPDRSVRRITYRYENSSSLVYSTTYSGESQPASGLGQGGPSFGIRLINSGYHAHTVSEQLQITSSLSAELVDDGVVVSRITSTGSSQRVRTWTIRVEVYAGAGGIAETRNSNTTQVSGSWSRTTSFDGNVVDEVSGSVSGSNWHATVRDVTPFNLAQQTAWAGGWGAEFELDANAGYTSRRMCIMPQHYTAQMHALGCTTWDVSGDQPLNIVNKLGDVACMGTRVPGWVSGPLPSLGYFGSYNPVTREALRDTSAPVTYI